MKLWRTLAAVALTITASLSGWAQYRSGSGAGGAIAAGTQIQVRFIDDLNSETAREGNTFRATLEQAIVDGDRILYPKGADVTGRIVFAHPSGRLSDPGELELMLTEITTGGRSYPVSTDPLNIRGESHTKSNAGKIGGGAALGAVIGAIAGGGKGAAIGAGVGAGAGTATAAATGKKEAKIESEAVLTFMAAGSSRWPATDAAKREDVERSYDDPRGSRWSREFTSSDRREIRSCLSNPSNLPPGLARRDSLPPGLEKQLQRNGSLPPGLQKRIQPLPDGCSANLPRLPEDWGRVVVGRHVLLLDPEDRIADLFALDEQD